MISTRIRKKGCPFCKAKPSECIMAVIRDLDEICVYCPTCGATGPEVSKKEGFDQAWSKWNQRG